MGRLLGTFLVIVFIIMIVQAIFGVFSAMYGAISEFLLNTIWGFIAFVFLGLAGFFFYASSRTMPQVREKGRVIDTIKPLLQRMDSLFDNTKSTLTTMTNSLVSKFHNEENVIDLSKVNLQAMVRKLAVAINKPNPVFFKWWGNRRLELDVERVYIIKEYIEAIQAAGESFVHLQADAVLSYEKIKRLVQINRNELLRQLRDSELQIDLLEAEYKAKADKLRIDIAHLEALVYEKLAEIENLQARTEEILSDIKNKSKEVDAEIERRRKESDSEIKRREEESKAKIELDYEKSDAEIFVMKMKATDMSRLSKQRAKVLDKIIGEMNLNNIRPIEVYLLVKLLEPANTDDYFDFDSRIKMVDEQIEKMRIENKKATAEAREANAKADEVEAQSKQNIIDLNKNR